MHGPRSVIEDPLWDDPATTQWEINEHGNGVRWSFVLRRTVLRLRSLAVV